MREQPEFPPIKFDLQTRFGSIYGDEEKEAMNECLARDAPTSNKSVKEFEEHFAEYCGVEHAVTTSNGTAALFVSFKALGVGPRDEVISTPVTWIATSAAAVTLGARIRFCDVDPATMNMDPANLEGLITKYTKAICPVHLYGQPVDMDAINEIASDHDIPVVEDAAHAPGATYKGKKTGNLGTIGCFSFHEQKNMSTLGEGGMVTTNDEELYERIRSYKSHCARVIGPSTKYLSFSDEIADKALSSRRHWYQDFDDCGYNFRMADMPAAVGIVQLKRLDGLNKNRVAIARRLDDALKRVEGITPLSTIQGVEHVYHLYPVIVDEEACGVGRDSFIHEMRNKAGVKVGVHYMPLVQTTAFKSRGHDETECPIAVDSWMKLATLPIHPRMEGEHVEYLIESMKLVIEGK
ncbi:MAG: DegT/DnrJ/EryC1/StrS family aminotransferase [Candidatus Hodarchaeota archaeon]